MHILILILIGLATFLFMEGVAWFTHKYIMHGFLWSWHRSHHKVHPHPLEMNDLFSVVFSIPSILCFYFGYANDLHWLTAIGAGVLGYGVFYFLFHDIIVHRRVKIPFKAKSNYMKRMIRAHYVHHEKHTKEDGEAFGFLYAPKKYAKER